MRHGFLLVWMMKVDLQTAKACPAEKWYSLLDTEYFLTLAGI